MSQQLKEAQQTEKQDNKTLNVDQERIPMIVCVSELPKFFRVVTEAKQDSEFYQFLIKNIGLPI